MKGNLYVKIKKKYIHIYQYIQDILVYNWRFKKENLYNLKYLRQKLVFVWILLPLYYVHYLSKNVWN